MNRATGVQQFGLFLIALAAASAAPAADIPYEWNGVARIVAIGDVHGAYDNVVAILQNTGLIDHRLRWMGGSAHLVQLGDVVDRGPHSRKAMDLLMRLEKESVRAGGRVHVLIGNHEAMNVVGLLDYVSAEAYAAFAEKDSAARREIAFELHYERRKAEARKAGGTLLPKDMERHAFELQYPLGYVEHRLAFHPQGRYGRWILTHNVAVRINGIVFSHGDWSEEMAALGIGDINRRVREELSGKRKLEGGVTFHPQSPLQFRGLARVPLEASAQRAHQAQVERILSHLQSRFMVVAHTPTRGIIEPRFQGRHLSVDTGMLELYDGGHRIALDIQGEKLRAMHPEGQVEIPAHLDEETLPLYVASVAAVDPQNRTVQRGRGSVVAVGASH